MSRRITYNELKAAVSRSDSVDKVSSLLSRAKIDDIHGYFCKELSEKHSAACASCKELLRPPVRRRDTGMIMLLLYRGVYPPVQLCATEYRYGRRNKPWTPLKRAVESGSLDDVRKLLSAGADVNAHPRICAVIPCELDYNECADCDTPLMAAVRRRDVAMMRLLIAHGANVSRAIPDIDPSASCKTALLVAAITGDEHVITELVTSGADVNQPLGLRGTVLHHCCDNDRVLMHLVRLGADPNAEAEMGASVFFKVLLTGEATTSMCCLDSLLQSLRLLLPTTHDLDGYLRRHDEIIRLKTECSMLLLQHGANICYKSAFLLKSAKYVRWAWGNRKKHSEEFIELLRAADTDFRGVRQRIASLDRTEWEMLNLDVLEEKLSQPLTLQTSCVISVRRRLRSIRDVGLWRMIDALPLSAIIKDRLKLVVW